MTKRSTWALPYAIFLVLFVALPLILIILYAFQDGSGNFTFGNFIKFFTDADAIGTFALSLEVAIENTAICILLGYPAAWILANKKLNKSAVTIVLFIMPMWINALMRTLATAELFHMLGIQLGKICARGHSHREQTLQEFSFDYHDYPSHSLIFSTNGFISCKVLQV